jgi:ferredoxin-NADP reductase
VVRRSDFLPGVRVRISLPRNNFKLNEDASHSILIAGGIGITPLISMAHRAADPAVVHPALLCPQP